jgi:hypothetical protein
MVSPLVRRSCLPKHRFDESIFADSDAIFHRVALTHRFAYRSSTVGGARRPCGKRRKGNQRNRETTLASLRLLRMHPMMNQRRAQLVDLYKASMLRAYAWQAGRLIPIVNRSPWTRLPGSTRLVTVGLEMPDRTLDDQ